MERVDVCRKPPRTTSHCGGSHGNHLRIHENKSVGTIPDFPARNNFHRYLLGLSGGVQRGRVDFLAPTFLPISCGFFSRMTAPAFSCLSSSEICFGAGGSAPPPVRTSPGSSPVLLLPDFFPHLAPPSTTARRA